MINSEMINSGVETPISSMEGITPSRKFSTPLDLAQAFGQSVDVVEAVQDPIIVVVQPSYKRFYGMIML